MWFHNGRDAVCLRRRSSVQFIPPFMVFLITVYQARWSLDIPYQKLAFESPELTIVSHQYGQLFHLLAGIVELVTDVQRFVLFSPHKKKEKNTSNTEVWFHAVYVKEPV